VNVQASNPEADEYGRLRQADIEHYVHPNTRLKAHTETGPVIWARGEGSRLQDVTGRWYVDGMACLWNVNVGHGRRELIDAAMKQMNELEYASTFSGFGNRPAIELSEKLSEITPGHLSAVMFGNSGSEMNDTAFKIARYYWRCVGKPEKTAVIARLRAFHGVTMGAVSATGLPVYWDMFGPRAPDFHHVDPPYPYRQEANAPSMTGEAIEQKILELGPENVAAVIGEPILGGGGVIVPPDGYWQNVRRICDKYDVLLIADEIINGFGRTGKWFGIENWGVAPDIMVMAKGITSGYLPLSACMMTEKVYQGLQSRPDDPPFMHGHTYAGHPTVCAVALANIALIEREGLVERARVMGEYLQRKLEGLRNLPMVGDTRGLGLVAGVELVRDKATKENFPANWRVGIRVMGELQERGIILRSLLGDIIAMSPPLVITEAEVDQVVTALGDSIETVAKDLASAPVPA
jgi:adenosylmethionine-8-amino-7-oxononanoate aminotransferase